MASNVWGDGETEFFYQLTPEVVLDAIEELGLKTTGRCLTLNSMENRVFEIEIELDHTPEDPSDSFRVAKFYRPGRWSKNQILDEHEFILDLLEHDIPVIAPIKIKGETLFELKEQKLYYCLYPRQGGRSIDELNDESVERLGRLLARIHQVGASKKSEHRIKLGVDTYGHGNLNYLLENDLIPRHLRNTYESLCFKIFDLAKPLFNEAESFRVHGDCHWGNIIWNRKNGPFFIDFDDMLTAPAIQDIWLILPGRDQIALQNRALFLEAYEEWRPFPRSTLKLIEPLRTLRYIHFAAWIGKRWEDPSFKTAFPFYGTESYWESQTTDLQEQLSLIQNELSHSPFY